MASKISTVKARVRQKGQRHTNKNMEVLKKSTSYVLPSKGNRLTYLSLLLAGIFIALLLAPAPTPASALTTVPTKMNFQGRLADSAGNIKANGTYNMRLKLYTVSTGGTNVWSEDRLVSATQGVTVTNGTFSVQLGSATTLPASLFASGGLYLEVELPTPATATSASPTWTEGPMTPRNQMATSAYAYNAETLDGLDSANFGQVAVNNIFTGTNLFKPVAGSTVALDVQTTGSVSVLKVDTTNNVVSITNLSVQGYVATGNGAGEAASYINGGSTGSQRLSFQTGGTTTWSIGAIGGTANPGFEIQRYNAGAYINSPLIINNTTGAILLSGAVSGTSTISGTQLNSTVATGTAPLTVASTTKVTNLNADLLDGFDSADFSRLATPNTFTGANTFRNAINSTSAFGIQDTASNMIFNIDTTAAGEIRIFDPKGAPSSWKTSANSLPIARNFHKTVTVNGYIYVFGGANSAGTDLATVSYAKIQTDGEVQTWQTAASLPETLNEASIAVSGSTIYIMGGNPNKEVVYFTNVKPDGSLAPWKATTPMTGYGTYAASAVVMNGYLYNIGGWGNGGGIVLYAKIQADGQLGSWGTTTGLPAGRLGLATGSANGYIYVIGGACCGVQTNTIFYAKQNSDGTVGAWSTATNSLPANTAGHGSTISNGYMYVFGGRDTATYNTVRYAKINQSGDLGPWSTSSLTLPVGIYRIGTVGIVNGTAYIAGGYDGTNVLSSVYYSRLSPSVTIGGNIDLVSPQGGTLADGTGSAGDGSMGGSITAGNIIAVGSLQIHGSSNFKGDMSSTGSFSVLSSNGNVLSVDSSSSIVSLGLASTTDSFTKLADPAALPTGTGNRVAYSTDGMYMSVAHTTSPFVTIYKRSGDTFTKLANPATLPTGTAYGTAFSPDGLYLSVVHGTTPFVTIYKRSGDTFTKLANPASLPTDIGVATTFSPDGNYLIATQNTTPNINIYKRSGDTFTKLANPATLPAAGANGVGFSPDGIYMSVVSSSSPYLIIYKRSGDTFTKLGDPAVMPAGSSFDTTFSPDGIYMTVAHSTTPYLTIYKRSGDTFNKLADPTVLSSSSGRGVSFSPDGKYLGVTADGGPSVIIYKRLGDTFTKLTDPAFLPTTGGAKDIEFSNDSQYLTTVYTNSPYITNYRVGSGNSSNLSVSGAITTTGNLQSSSLQVQGQGSFGDIFVSGAVNASSILVTGPVSTSYANAAASTRFQNAQGSTQNVIGLQSGSNPMAQIRVDSAGNAVFSSGCARNGSNVLVCGGTYLNWDDGEGGSVNNGGLFANLNASSGGFAICHTGGANTTLQIQIVDCASAPTADYAEYYPTETNVEPGEIVAITPNMYSYEAQAQNQETGAYYGVGQKKVSILKRASLGDSAIGIVSTNPHEIIGHEIPETTHRSPIAMNGRVPLKVNNEGGEIQPGDQIALSSVPGVGAKAYESGKTIAVALEGFNGEVGTIMAYVQAGYHSPLLGENIQAASIGATNLQITGSTTLNQLNVSGLATIQELKVVSDLTVQGNITVIGKIETGNIIVNGHITTRGATPTIKEGTAMGNLGMNSSLAIDGTDAAGSVRFKVSDVQLGTGVIAHVGFAEDFDGAYKTVISSTNEAATDLRVYIVKTATGFDIVSKDPLRTGVEYSFDYIVIGAQKKN